jgi:hypothetical protein
VAAAAEIEQGWRGPRQDHQLDPAHTAKESGVACWRGPYERIDDDGLHLRVDGATRVLAVDTIVVRGAGPRRELVDPLRGAGIPDHTDQRR